MGTNQATLLYMNQAKESSQNENTEREKQVQKRFCQSPTSQWLTQVSKKGVILVDTCVFNKKKKGLKALRVRADAIMFTN